MIAQRVESSRASNGTAAMVDPPGRVAETSGKGRVLLVEDDADIREAMGPLLTEEGYDVSYAENGHEALQHLRSEELPAIILLDLRMPVMNGWEFRAIQRDDPKLSLIPVVTFSADGSAQAVAISAQGRLRKPLTSKEILTTIERVLLEAERQRAAGATEIERLASMGRLAANVGHEINNPLSIVMVNLALSLEALESAARAPATLLEDPSSAVALAALKTQLGVVCEMLRDCQRGGERIRETISTLQQLTRRDEERRATFDVRQIIEQSVSMAWDEIHPRARLVQDLQSIAPIGGDGLALRRVFLNLLLNAAQAIPKGAVESNEIHISSQIQACATGEELVVAISDSGCGIPPELLLRVFEPFFTTRAQGEGTGLGLSISRQTVLDHGGRLTVESEVGKGSVFRVFLPVGGAQARMEM